MLSQALFMAGRLNEALEAGAVALAAIAEQGGFETNVTLGLNANQLLGFDVEHWIKCLRTRILIRLGRFGEARTRLAEVLQAAPERVAAVVEFIPHFASVELAWAVGDPDLANRHAAKVTELAEQSAMPYLHVAAMTCAGMARGAAGDFAAGAQDLRRAIDFARGARAGLEFEARMLADFADLLYRAGDLDTALEASAEAITVARRRTDRVAECHALLIRGMTLAVVGGGADDAEAHGLLEQAEQLLDVSGAGFFEPRLAQLRSDLERRG